MKNILGLDLGTNSIGWALIENNKIIGIGSRIFPEGVLNLGEGEGREVSKNASRTEARGIRRQIFRRRLRKRYLLKELAKYKLCPISPHLIKEWNGAEVFKVKKLQEWLQLNPYNLRAKAILEKVTLLELGRIFYHMIQRRGFLSNSRSVGAAAKESSTIFKGAAKIGKIGIRETLEQIEKTKTLGSYLHSIHPKQNEPFSGELARIRNRYTTRQMYVDEFEAIWEFQKHYHAELNTTIKSIFGGRKKDGYKENGVLFHQRPLRSQKHLVGACSFEPKKTKCGISTIPFEMFKIYQWVNTLQYDANGVKQKITALERTQIINLLLSKEHPTFKEIRKLIHKVGDVYQFNYKDDYKIVGAHTISNLSNKKFFGPQWFKFSREEQEKIWHVLSFFDDSEKLKVYARKNWGFTEDKALQISEFNLKEGYANLSRKAINNILPFLEKGFMYDVSVGLAGVQNVLAEEWEQHKVYVLATVPAIVRSNSIGGYIGPLKNMMRREFKTTEKQLKKLYFPSSTIETVNTLERLPVHIHADREIQRIKNPVVITALFEIRKLINEIIDTYGKPDAIKVALAQNLKGSKQHRLKVRKQQNMVEKENDRIKEILGNLHQNQNHTTLLKYKLWEECNQTCPFTGKIITVHQLFTSAVEIVHIFPWSRSLNDSYLNKTLCFADENVAIGNKTPYEFYSAQGAEKWAAIKSQALHCFKIKSNYPSAYQKFKHFIKQQQDEDFMNRHLNDTRYISKEAKNYLSKICGNVLVVPGQMTATLRHHWGLNSLLNKKDEIKNSHDHRQHALDALVMAAATRSHLQELTKRNRYDSAYKLKEFPGPWKNFRAAAEKAIAGILVSHKKQKRLTTQRTHTTKKNGVEYKNTGIAARGQLHKESVYGVRKAPNANKAFHIRKPLESFTTEKQLDKIVDDSIRYLIFKRIQQVGGFIKGKIPKETFFIMDENGEKRPQLFLPNRNGNPVPIKKVRINVTIGAAEKLKENLNQYVSPRKNHHALIYRDIEGNLKEHVVTFWTVVERKIQGQDLYQLPADGKEIVTTIEINDMFLLGLSNIKSDVEKMDAQVLREHLFRVQKFTSGDYYFRKSNAATLQYFEEKQQINSFGFGKNGWQSHNPIKVSVNSIGILNLVSL